MNRESEIARLRALPSPAAEKLTAEQHRDLERWLDGRLQLVQLAGGAVGAQRGIRADLTADQRAQRREHSERILLDHSGSAAFWALWQLKYSYRPGRGNTPSAQRRKTEYAKRTVEVDLAPVPTELRHALSVGTNDGRIRIYEEMCDGLLAQYDDGSRWVRHRRFRERVHPLVRSVERADECKAAVNIVLDYHDDLLTALRRSGRDATLALMLEIIETNGFKIGRSPLWGGPELQPADHPPMLPDFPESVVNERVKKERRIFEYKLGRELTDVEVETTCRCAADDFLRRKQEALLMMFGVPIAVFENAKRSDRRQRSREWEQKPSHDADLLACIIANPSFGRNELAMALHRGKDRISAGMLALERAGFGKIDKVGQKQVFIPDPKRVPPIEGEKGDRK